MQFSTIISLAIVAASMSIQSAMAAPAAPAACNKVCTMIYQPVCAKLKTGETKTFGNACTLGVYNCENPSNQYEFVAESACEELPPTCDIMCAMIDDPVCATSKDGKSKRTFSNACLLTVFNCKNPENTFSLVSNDSCEADDAPVPEKRAEPVSKPPACNMMCTMEYDPVCATSLDGSHSLTFGNKCELSVYNCKNPGNTYRPVANDNCSAGSPVAVVSIAAAADPAVLEAEDLALEDSTAKCGNVCMMLYAPVCAKNKKGELRAFGNKCLLSIYNCKNPKATLEYVTDKSCFLM
ncbi:hypothetical protein BGX29_010328 [Mortierella sp. GBA35]|nr:hypothetical protein BGX29_010328 [Mortierella sp. GBA35]